MEPILILLAVFLPVFIIAGSITAFVALSKTNRIARSFESYKKIISDVLNRLTELQRRLSMLEGHGARPTKAEPPPIARPTVPADPVQPLAPEPEQLDEETPAAEAVELHPTVVEPVKVEAPPEPTPPPAPTPPQISPEPPQTARPRAVETNWTDFESAAGKRWLTWGGVVILFLSAAFFLKHAFDVGWIGPGVQVLLAVAAGGVLLGLGELFLRQDMRPLGRGLIGGGIMVLYAALFAAYSPNFYKTPVIESQELTFALMCGVTVIAMALAIRHDAISISFLAILGGMLTPILVSKGIDARDTLFSYILLLDVGVLAVAFYKKWRALDTLAFVGTIVLFWGWWSKFGIGAPVGPPLAWLAAFWGLFAILPAAHHIRRRTELTVERLLMSMANATYGFAFAYLILEGRPEDLAWAALVMSGAYLTLGVLVRFRGRDAKAMFGFISMSMLFLTLFAPLRFGLNGITLAWLGEAVVLVCLGFLFDYRPVRIGGFITLLLGTGRVFLVHYNLPAIEGDLLPAFANTNFWTMMCAPIAGGLIAVVHQFHRRKSEPEDKQIQAICTIGSGLLALMLLSIEIDRWFRGLDELTWAYRTYLNHCSKIALWTIGAAAFLSGAPSRMARPLRIAGLFPLLGALGLAAYTFTIDHGASCIGGLNPLFGASMLACGVIWAYSLSWEDEQTRNTCVVGSALITLGFFSLELDHWFQTLDLPGQYLHYLEVCAMSALWTVATLAFMGGSRLGQAARGLRKTAVVPLIGAAVLIVYAFALDPIDEPGLFVNIRFAAAFFVSVVIWIQSLTWPDEKSGPELNIVSSYATVGLICAEVLPWVWRMAPVWKVDQIYTTYWVAAMLTAACAAAYLAIGRMRKAREAYYAGLAPLIIAWFCSLRIYFLTPQGRMLMFVNPRFIAAMLTLAVMLAWPAVMRSDRRESDAPSEAIVPLYVWFTASLLALLTIEPAGWLHRNIADIDQSAWTVQMSISIVWGLYASAMLSIGFWKRVTPLRLAALALFGLTAVKLLAVDMANIRKIYRIVSFFVMGILMVAASYAYHKAEKRLKKSEQELDIPQTNAH